jgi:hypothetical protein
MVAKLRSSSSRPTAFLRLAYSAPQPGESSSEEVRRSTLPATKALPFVKLRANDQPTWRPERYWHFKSTGKRNRDIQLGRKYARDAMAAMRADDSSNLIALVIQDMIIDAVEQSLMTGHCRPGSATMGFLSEISARLAAAR